MSELRMGSLTMPAVKLGSLNPLPPLERLNTDPGILLPPDLSAEMQANVAYGRVSSILPYSYQDGFDRHLEETRFKVAILENDILRATFLPEFGGRLWSLVHKPSNRELLEVNPVFQLANLAVRKAWFSGGVEWNVGTIGHSPFTCSPLFACRVDGYDGEPVLRLYEWERLRGMPFQIDAYLPSESQVLFIRVRLQNPNEYKIPMYWWSNIAVPETSDTRVLVPANSAYCLGCEAGHLTRIPVPEYKGVDYTYATNVTQAADFFFELSDDQSPWIAALDGEGKGLVQFSTNQLKGRKLWVWGQGIGGRNWQKFLSPPGAGYIEIQAGLTRTQLEHQPLPAGESWSWLESYGLLKADPEIVHGSDWPAAWQHVDGKVNDLLTAEELAAEHQRGTSFEIAEPVEFFQLGSGWGAVAHKMRKAADVKGEFAPGLLFLNNSITVQQSPWMDLIETGSFPEGDPQSPPDSFVVDAKLSSLLERSITGVSKKNWLGWYYAGLIRYHEGDVVGARQAWEESLAQLWTPWAMRNLAILSWQQGDTNRAGDLLIEAYLAAPEILPLAVECGRCLIECGRSQDWLDLMRKMSTALRSHGRLRLLEAQASLLVGDIDMVEKFFEQGVLIADLREGESSLTDLWFEYQAKKTSIQENIPLDDNLLKRVKAQIPVPKNIDYRLKLGIGV
jgi:hypothetical protein